MKKISLIILIGLFAFSPQIYSQNVSINSTGSLPDASAMLDISSTTSGFLLPRMTTAQQNAIASPATGLLIYNTTTGYFMVNTGTPGSPVWTPLAFNNTGWSLLGNSGTVDGTNFLGTTNNVPLNFKVNNQKAGRIDNTNANTFFGYQAGNSNTTGIQNTFIGQRSGYNNLDGYWNTFVGDSAGYSTTSGYRNTSIGYQSLYNNTTGWFNNAFGHKTLYSNTTGSDNMAVGQAALYGNLTGIHNIAVGNYTLETTTSGGNNTAVGYAALYFNNDATGDNIAVGYNAMYNSTAGHSNTAMGTSALTNTTGNYNTAIGNNTGGTNTTGSNNTFIGTNANPSTGALTNATAIGYNATVGSSNSLVLGGTGANAVSVGIGTTTPTAALHLRAGLATASGAPLKFTAGTNLTTKEAGAIEFNGTHLYFTATNGGTRYQLDQQNSLNATYQGTPADPSSTSTGSPGIMLGLGGSAKITPVVNGNIMIVISGDLSNSSQSSGAMAKIRYGTGSAPAWGSSGSTGTGAGSAVNLLILGAGNTAGTTAPFSCNAIVTGLSVGTTYWIDLSLAQTSGGTATAADISISIMEL